MHVGACACGPSLGTRLRELRPLCTGNSLCDHLPSSEMSAALVDALGIASEDLE